MTASRNSAREISLWFRWAWGKNRDEDHGYIKCAVIASSPVIRITTDDGITGWSQIETPRPYLQPIVLQLKSWLVGQDPVNVERVMRRIRVRGGFKPWGSAVSAIEIALWDIAGKAASLPVYRLLGGKVRDQVRPYRTLYHDPGIKHRVEDYVRWAEIGKALPEKFTMFKLRAPRRRVSPTEGGSVQTDVGLVW